MQKSLSCDFCSRVAIVDGKLEWNLGHTCVLYTFKLTD